MKNFNNSFRRILVPEVGLEQAAGARPEDYRADDLCKILRKEFRPHRLAKDTAGRLFEFISFPWAEGVGNGVGVFVHVRVPGDPMSMEKMSVFHLTPEGMDCSCDAARTILGRDTYYLTPEYYKRREAERKFLRGEE